ncbi:MAG: hypothetical protein TREMPRED_004662 [Tremellales sp. Tagirdzhanova-0007]|nr:MAG: hypothetical protein TREMPRED_004662 [Tremellales sp. Tagirdzhanova-0007]
MSPQADMGYDISDYRNVDPRYGTLEDWEKVLEAVHERGMKLVMDLVVNHSSEEHAWFKESRSSLSNPKRDWYIWRPAKYNDKGERVPPNNWKSVFGQDSAWEWEPTTEQYYLHLFLKEQPDLNWENEELRKEVYEMMHWWFKKGIDGFRMDVINFISKAEGLPDAPVTDPNRSYQGFGGQSCNRKEVHGFMKEMNKEVLSDYDCFAVGETPGNGPVSEYAPYSVPSNRELQMIFHFHHQSFDRAGGGLHRVHNPDWKLSDMKKTFTTWQVEMEQAGGWNSNYVENHDQPRTVSRMASDHPADRAKSAKLLSMFHCALGGTIFIYQGQEIGTCNVPREWSEEEYKDVETIQHIQGERDHRRKMTSGKNPDVSDLLKGMRETARDNARTPIQWDSSENAGFTKGTPWMRVHDDYAQGWNVAAQVDDPDSVWSFWQHMLKLRKQYEALIYGKFLPLDEANEETYGWIRDDPTIDQRLLVILNFARGDGRGARSTFTPTNIDTKRAKLIVTNGPAKIDSGIDGDIKLEPWEGRIYLL